MAADQPTSEADKLPEQEAKGTPPDSTHDVEQGVHAPATLHRGLQGRHMQMIAIGTPSFLNLEASCTDCNLSGGSIGAGLFVSSGSALQSGGPASLLLGFVC